MHAICIHTNCTDSTDSIAAVERKKEQEEIVEEKNKGSQPYN